ncbi:MAG: hypothetical protein AAGG55_05760 [Pseudomonadota bacterium]
MLASVQTNPNFGVVTNLIQVWMISITKTPHSEVNHLPWFAAFIAIVLLSFGHLRALYGNTAALFCCAAVASLPLLHTHAALAGYADIWVTLFFVASIAVSCRVTLLQKRAYLIVLLLSLVLCMLTKRAGLAVALALGVVLFGCFAWETLAKKSLLMLVSSAIVISGGFLAALLGFYSLDWNIPGLGQFQVSTSGFGVENLFYYNLKPAPFEAEAYFDALLTFDNWHLATPLFLASLALIATQPRLAHGERIPILAVIATLLVLVVYFTFIASGSATLHTGLDRSLLYVMPSAITVSTAILCKSLIASFVKT